MTVTDLAERGASDLVLASAVLDVGDLPVEVVLWPREAARREALARAGVPRVLVVEENAEPPAIPGLDEDWVRLPARPGEVAARALHLLRSTAQLRTDDPYIDSERILHRGGATVQLSAAEATITMLLLRQSGTIVGHDVLCRAVWPGAAPSRDALDAAIYRLRRRLAGLSMCIRSLRGRGFVLELRGGH